MLSYIIAFVVGIVEFSLLYKILRCVFDHEIVKMLIFIALKFIIYGVSVFLLIKMFRYLIVGTAIGFGAGFAVCFIILLVVSMKKKK